MGGNNYRKAVFGGQAVQDLEDLLQVRRVVHIFFPVDACHEVLFFGQTELGEDGRAENFGVIVIEDLFHG